MVFDRITDIIGTTLLSYLILSLIIYHLLQNFVKKKNAPRLIGNDNAKDITNSTTC